MTLQKINIIPEKNVLIKDLKIGDTLLELFPEGPTIRLIVYEMPVIDEDNWVVVCKGRCNQFFTLVQKDKEYKIFHQLKEVGLIRI